MSGYMHQRIHSSLGTSRRLSSRNNGAAGAGSVDSQVLCGRYYHGVMAIQAMTGRRTGKTA